jgi:HD superfamily phosphohydrolase
MPEVGEEIVFKSRILDNVHGFIYYTEAEEKIMETLLFKRLQSIKQLSVADWVFPGSEHTRFVHSLGVMYIADKIAIRLGLSVKDRKIIRLAGLLHDIGHYPLSHVGEYPYRKNLKTFSDDATFCLDNNKDVLEKVQNICDPPDSEYMRQSSGYHHEQIGSFIVTNNREIKSIIISECGEDAPEIISDMITGNTARETTNPLFVQILHSELDADGIDYLMRDAMFSGTSFGSFEIEQLIGCMESHEYEGKKILCINSKGIAAADQYLINKFFSYSQVIYNKHICISEWMAEQVVNWMQKHSAYFPKGSVLKEWAKAEGNEEKFIDFTDNFFWSSLQDLLKNELAETTPSFIRKFCESLLRHNELQYVDQSEVKCILKNNEEIRNIIKNSQTFSKLNEQSSKDNIGILLQRKMSTEIKEEIFNKTIENDDSENSVSKEDADGRRIRRLMEGICIHDENGFRLLCDDNRSLMYSMNDIKMVVLRLYKLGVLMQ